MSVKIRLRRMGAKKRPFYRLVVADSRRARDGRFIETLGYYNPCVEPSELKIDDERARHWLSVGAQPSDTVAGLFKRQGLLERSAKVAKPEAAAPAASEAPVPAASEAPIAAAAPEASAEPVTEIEAPETETPETA